MLLIITSNYDKLAMQTYNTLRDFEAFHYSLVPVFPILTKRL